MAHSFNKSQHNTNAFEQRVQFVATWIAQHREQSLTVLGTVAIAILFLVFTIHHRELENNDAWTQLGNVQGALMQGQTQSAAKALDQWQTRYPSSSASNYAQFLHADLLYRTSDYAGAAQVYENLATTAKPADALRPLALSGASAAEEMAGHLPQALALTQQFVEQHADHYLAATMMLSQARLLEMTGNPSGASAVYDRFTILYPQSPWTALAHARLQALAPSPAPPATLK